MANKKLFPGVTERDTRKQEQAKREGRGKSKKRT